MDFIWDGKMSMQRCQCKAFVAEISPILQVRDVELVVPREESLREIPPATTLFQNELWRAGEQLVHIVFGQAPSGGLVRFRTCLWFRARGSLRFDLPNCCYCLSDDGRLFRMLVDSILCWRSWLIAGFGMYLCDLRLKRLFDRISAQARQSATLVKKLSEDKALRWTMDGPYLWEVGRIMLTRGLAFSTSTISSTQSMQ